MSCCSRKPLGYVPELGCVLENHSEGERYIDVCEQEQWKAGISVGESQHSPCERDLLIPLRNGLVCMCVCMRPRISICKCVQCFIRNGNTPPPFNFN